MGVIRHIRKVASVEQRHQTKKSLEETLPLSFGLKNESPDSE